MFEPDGLPQNTIDLLRLAAQAAGYNFRTSPEWFNIGMPEISIASKPGYPWEPWNPLTEQLDCGNLIIDCRISVSFSGSGAEQTVRANNFMSYCGNDPHGATRAMVTLAAAAMVDPNAPAIKAAIQSLPDVTPTHHKTAEHTGLIGATLRHGFRIQDNHGNWQEHWERPPTSQEALSKRKIEILRIVARPATETIGFV